MTLHELLELQLITTDEEREWYTESDCYRLAYELHKLAELPLYASVKSDNYELWSHMVVEWSPGLYLDVEGFATEDEVLERHGRWRSMRLLPIDEQEFFELTEEHYGAIGVVRDDREVAERILRFLSSVGAR